MHESVKPALYMHPIVIPHFAHASTGVPESREFVVCRYKWVDIVEILGYTHALILPISKPIGSSGSTDRSCRGVICGSLNIIGSPKTA